MLYGTFLYKKLNFGFQSNYKNAEINIDFTFKRKFENKNQTLYEKSLSDDRTYGVQ